MNNFPTFAPRRGRGSPDPAVRRTEGLTPGHGSETCGRPGGKVGRPCHSAFTNGWDSRTLFPSRSLVLIRPAPQS